MCGEGLERGKKLEAGTSIGGCHSCIAKRGWWLGLGCCHRSLADGLGMGTGRRGLVWPERKMTFEEGVWDLIMEVLGCQGLYLGVRESF